MSLGFREVLAGICFITLAGCAQPEEPRIIWPDWEQSARRESNVAIEIRAPIWKTNSIGIALYKVGPGENDVRITYKDKNGKLLFPDTYTVTREELMTRPRQLVGEYNTELRIIPIAELRKKL